MSNEKSKPLYTANKILSPRLLWNKSRLRLRFEGSCLKQEETSPFIRDNILNLFIVCELDAWSRDLHTDFTLKDSLFWAVKLTKNADPDKCFYSAFEIGFYSHSLFSTPNFDWGKNAVLWGVHMSSSVHIDNKKKHILIFSKFS